MGCTVDVAAVCRGVVVDTDGADSVICFGDDVTVVCIGFSTDCVVCVDVRTDAAVIGTVSHIGDLLYFVVITVVLCSAAELSACVEVLVDSCSTDVVSVAVVVDGAVDTVAMKGRPCSGDEVTFIVDKLFSFAAVDPHTANGEPGIVMTSLVCSSVV